MDRLATVKMLVRIKEDDTTYDAKLNYWGDWRNALLKSRLRQEYTIDFSGKNKKADYFISAGYLNDKGVFSIQRFERYSTRANLNYNVNKWLKVGTNIACAKGLPVIRLYGFCVRCRQCILFMNGTVRRMPTDWTRTAIVFLTTETTVHPGVGLTRWLMIPITSLLGHMTMFPIVPILK